MFCRFAGCNLWSGREQDRAKAVCRFCDTQFVGTDGVDGGKFSSPHALAMACLEHWPNEHEKPFIVLTGGEPLLQLDEKLIDALHDAGFEIAVETNGTLKVPPAIDWVCVSPKAGAEFVQRSGDELKLVVPQNGIDPQDFAALAFDYFYLQPLDGPELAQNTQDIVSYCQAHPQWRLSLQTHKLIGIA